MLKLQIVGTLGKDSIVTEISGEKYTKFPVATQDKKDEPTIWVDCLYRGEKSAEWLKKGCKVFVEGGITMSCYTNKNTGETKPNLTCWVRDYTIVQWAKQEGQNQEDNENGKGDLPF